MIRNGINPSKKREVEKQEAIAETLTFEKVARDWHSSNKRWSTTHSERVLGDLRRNVFPAIGNKSIATLEAKDLLAPLKEIESSGRLELASRQQQRITVISFATIRVSRFSRTIFSSSDIFRREVGTSPSNVSI